MDWYLNVIKNYADFSGRARRKEYWMFSLINILIYTALIFIEISLGGIGLIAGVYILAVFIPTLAVTVRRLHDSGRSGWWILITFLPIIGGIIFFIFMLLDSSPEQNQHGASPKAIAA